MRSGFYGLWCLFLLFGVFSFPSLQAQTASDPNSGSKLEWDSTNEIWRFKWWGAEGRTYFLLHSENLILWNWAPVVESGNDAIKEWGFTTTGDRMFLRLRHTDLATTDPEVDDFDGDGIFNMAEVLAGSDPLNFYARPSGPFEVTIQIVSGNAQVDDASAVLANPLVVRVLDAATQNPVANAPVKFRFDEILSGAGISASATGPFSPSHEVRSNLEGEAPIFVQLPDSPGLAIDVLATANNQQARFWIATNGTSTAAINVWAAYTSTGSVDVGWTIPESSNVTEWMIQRQIAGGIWETLGSTAGDVNNWVDYTLPAGSQAQYRIVGVVEDEQGEPIGGAAPSGTAPQGGAPGNGIQEATYAGIKTSWWQQYFGGVALADRPSPDADVDLPTPDGMSNFEEYEASVWVEAKMKWVGPDPTKTDTDGDGVSDLEDGWATIPELAPARVSVSNYAVIDLGAGSDSEALFVNDRGEVVVKSSSGMHQFWKNGSLINIQHGDTPLTPAGLNNSGQVAVNFNNTVWHVYASVQLSPEFSAANPLRPDPAWYVSGNPESRGAGIWVAPNLLTELKGPSNISPEFNSFFGGRIVPTEFTDIWEPVEWLSRNSAVAAINDEGETVGYIVESWQMINRPADFIRARSQGWSWPGGGMGELSLFAQNYGIHLHYFSATTLFAPRWITNTGFILGYYQDRPEILEDEYWTGEFTLGYYSEESFVALPLDQMSTLSPANHIFGYKDAKPCFLVDSTSGLRADQPTSETPVFTSPIFIPDAVSQNTPQSPKTFNKCFQLLGNSTLWQNWKTYNLANLTPSFSGEAPTWHDFRGADLSDNGIIVGRATRLRDSSGALIPLEARTHHAVALLPVQIITINTFIPDNYVQPPFNDLFAGDDRINPSTGKAAWDKNGSHRTQQKVNLIPFRNMGDADGLEDNAYNASDPTGVKNASVLNHVQETTKFDPATSLSGGRISAAAKAEYLRGAPLMLDWATGSNSGMSITPTWLGERKLQIRCVVAADNPLVSGALWDNIDYDFTLIIDLTDAQGPKYSLTGSHDGFPAYEVYIGDKRVYEYDPIVTGESLVSLGPPMEKDVNATTSHVNQPLP